MTVDRAALRRLYNLPTSQARVSVYHAVPDLLDDLDAKDRRIAELRCLAYHLNPNQEPR